MPARCTGRKRVESRAATREREREPRERNGGGDPQIGSGAAGVGKEAKKKILNDRVG